MPSPKENETSDAKTYHRSLTLVTVLLLGLPPLYILSTGPVLWMLGKTNYFGGSIPGDWVISFYWPIVWLYLNTPMKRPIEWYLSLWGVS
jgi:hypothetical protein